VEGQNLGNMLDRELPRPLMERLILPLIGVVARARKNRIMLRDFEPHKIVTHPRGSLKLLDFGAAKLLAAEERYPSAVARKDNPRRRFPPYGPQSGRWPWIH
jgi:serine/threonine protein kinase